MAKEERSEMPYSAAEETSGPARPKDWWFFELWYANRELFKELIKHVVIFGLLFSALEGFHRVLNGSHLPAEELALLNKFHFWTSVVLFVIFTISLTIKAILYEIGVRK